MPLQLSPHSALAALDAFYREHQRCGELDGGLDKGTEGERVWMTCTCGAVISQALAPVCRLED